MKYLNLFILISFAAIAGCIKVDYPKRPADYIPGELVIDYNESIKSQSVANICFETNTPILQMRGIYFRSALPADSMNMIRRTLLSRPYIDSSSVNGSVKTTYDSSQVFVVGLIFRNVTKENMQDLQMLQDSLELTEYSHEGGAFPIGTSTLVQVPADSDVAYGYKFHDHPEVIRIRLFTSDLWIYK